MVIEIFKMIPMVFEYLELPPNAMIPIVISIFFVYFDEIGDNAGIMKATKTKHYGCFNFS